MSAQTLAYAGRTTQGHHRLLAPSRSKPGTFNEALVSKDGTRLSCDCVAANRHRKGRDGRLVLSRADVIEGRVEGVCWHLRRAAEWVPPVEMRRRGDGVLCGGAGDRLAPSDVRRLARLIRRAGHVVSKDLFPGTGRMVPGGWALLGARILCAVENLGFSTVARVELQPVRGGNSRHGRVYTAEAWSLEDDGLGAVAAVEASGTSRTAAAVALALGVERTTRGRRYRGRPKRAHSMPSLSRTSGRAA